MDSPIHVRFHGRGGQGAKLASRMVSRAHFLAGYVVQDSPVYGAERRGAPVTAFVRFGQEPIRERGYITNPEMIVVLDDSLLGQADAMVLGGLEASSVVLVNSPSSPAFLKDRHGIAGTVLAQDISSLALEVLGRHLLSAPMAGFAVKALGLVPWELLARAVECELSAADLSGAAVERNLVATRRAYDAASTVALRERTAAPARSATNAFRLPRLPAQTAAPTITAAGTSELRTTDGWRVYRPVIDTAGCTRCLLCFALCPEGAIHLDPTHLPVIDYAHCKGCLVCAAECPPKVIREVREVAA